jgi:hypothetical protein
VVVTAAPTVAPAPGRAAPGPVALWVASLLHPLRWPVSPHGELAGPILVGVAFGVLTRALLLRLDAAPFPSRPHGRINYLFLGLVASVLGALAPAALLTADYTAGVFLAIGVGQFHTVRQIERDMLLALDADAPVPRGRPYIEGLAMMLETRNYLVMLTAMLATAASVLVGLLGGAAVGLAAGLGVSAAARAGTQVGSLADVQAVPVELRDGAVRVGGCVVLPSPEPAVAAELPHALGLRVVPRGARARLTLTEPGQRQALLHNLSAHLGLLPAAAARVEPDRRVGSHEQLLLPAQALDPDSGAVVILLFPQVRSPQRAVEVVRRTPLLETVVHPRGSALP